MPQRDVGRKTKVMRNIARIVSTLFAALIVLSVIASTVHQVTERRTVSFSYESLGMAAFTLLIALGTVAGWWKDSAAGVLLTLVGAGFSLFVFVWMPSHDYFIILIFGLPFLLAGLLFLICWRRSKSESTSI